MRIAYLDCFSGISGDMLLGAMIDGGLNLTDLRQHLSCLKDNKEFPLDFTLLTDKVQRGGISATKVQITPLPDAQQPHRPWRAIKGLLSNSPLPPRVKAGALGAFSRLAEAEGKIHGVAPENVIFHEVGGIDSLIDIVGAFLGLELLKVDALYSSPLPWSRGKISSAHGPLPIPAPATLELARNFPFFPTNREEELVTPTAAAILAEASPVFAIPGPFKLSATGYGAGSRQEPQPNVLRLVLGEMEDLKQGTDEVHRPALFPTEKNLFVLETNLDDISPQLLGNLPDRLISAGALDAWIIPATMKKGRPGFLVGALAADQDIVKKLAAYLFRHTTTIGVRFRASERFTLPRKIQIIQTPFGPIRFKIALLDGTPVNITPEFDDCLKAAQLHGASPKEVYAAASTAASLHFETGTKT